MAFDGTLELAGPPPRRARLVLALPALLVLLWLVLVAEGPLPLRLVLCLPALCQLVRDDRALRTGTGPFLHRLALTRSGRCFVAAAGEALEPARPSGTARCVGSLLILPLWTQATGRWCCFVSALGPAADGPGGDGPGGDGQGGDGPALDGQANDAALRRLVVRLRHDPRLGAVDPERPSRWLPWRGHSPGRGGTGQPK